jgi:hypothetical protein
MPAAPAEAEAVDERQASAGLIGVRRAQEYGDARRLVPYLDHQTGAVSEQAHPDHWHTALAVMGLARLIRGRAEYR